MSLVVFMMAIASLFLERNNTWFWVSMGGLVHFSRCFQNITRRAKTSVHDEQCGNVHSVMPKTLSRGQMSPAEASCLVEKGTYESSSASSVSIVSRFYWVRCAQVSGMSKSSISEVQSCPPTLLESATGGWQMETTAPTSRPSAPRRMSPRGLAAFVVLLLSILDCFE